MTQTGSATTGKKQVIETLTAGAILLAIIGGAVNGTFGAVFNRVTDWFLPAVAPHSTVAVPVKKGTPGGHGGTLNGAVSTPTLLGTSVSSPAGTKARLYVGELGAFASSVNVEEYNLGSLADTDVDKCVETIVISGLAEGGATVYAQGLPAGLFAAESVPPQTTTAGHAHQQVVLLSKISAGTVLQVGADLAYGGESDILGTTKIEVQSVKDGRAVLAVNGEQVTCQI